MTARPRSLKEVAELSDSMAEFGLNFTDWLHEVRRLSSRAQVERSYGQEPRILDTRFEGGKTADAWLAAYAEHVASRIGRPPPNWAFHESRVATEPWFSDVLASKRLRASALARSPLAFKRRNLYTYSVELPLRLRPGRPSTSPDQRRRANAERQRLFRARRKAELKRLRGLFSGTARPTIQA
jgi:hypothetical protein